MLRMSYDLKNSNQKLKIAKNKSLLKEYIINNERSVYLNDKEEFQLELFNPTSDVLGCEIYLNGKKISNNLIVIRPGERIWLDRFIDTPEKFLFSTYQIEDSPTAKYAAKDNGNVTVNFYRERDKKMNITINQYPSYNQWCSPSVVDPCTYIYNYPNITSLNEETVFYYSSNTMNDAKLSFQSCASSPQVENSAASICNTSIETGRIEKGGESNQRFDMTSYDFETWCTYTETVMIVPMSQKVYNKSDLEKRYCVNCGKKLSPKFKYCPVCGTKIE